MNNAERPMSGTGNAEAQSEGWPSYVIERHAAWNTPPEVISNFVSEAAGETVERTERIINGESNEVYRVHAASGRELIVRISHDESGKFDREQWALERCAEAGVPVPAMLAVKDMELDGKRLQLCIETVVPGASMREIETSERLPGALRELGAALSKMHAVPAGGFGTLDGEGKGRYRTVSELIEGGVLSGQDKIIPKLSGRLADIHAVETAYGILRAEAPRHDSVVPRLIHNDLSPEHVLVEDGHVSGIIDFEHAFGGDPMLDLALWDFKHGKKYPLSFIREGYGSGVAPEGEFERTLNFWKIYRALMSLRYCLREGRAQPAERALAAIKRASAYFAEGRG